MAEPLQQRRQVVPANHLLQALGPRPVDPGDHEVWLGAARAVDAYRERWGLGRAAEPLGTAGTGPSLAALPADRLADHVRTERQLQAARTRLGLARARDGGARPRALTQRPRATGTVPARSRARRQELAPGRALVGRREPDLVHLLVRSEDERPSRSAVGHRVHREPLLS